MVIFILMKLFLLLLLLTPFYQLSAQITEERPGWYNGSNVHQKDIDSLFKVNPKAEELSITYLDSTLILPNFTELDILGIRSETLQNLQLPGLMPNLGLLDLYTPKLHAISAVQTPELFELMIHAQLDSMPAFLCTSPELTLVSITNYKAIPIPQCLDSIFKGGQLEWSSLEFLDGKDGNTISKIVSPDNAPDEWLEDSDDMSPEEYEEDMKKMKRSARLISFIRRSSGVLLAGVVFLIWKS
jgi:hypothetical protein